MLFLDTNIFIRYLIKDDPKKAQQAYKLLKQVEQNQVVATTSGGVVIEVVYVLLKVYETPKQDIAMYLKDILNLRGLKLEYKRTYLHALTLFTQYNMDFVDLLCYVETKRRKIATIVSYDRDFDKLPDITRIEP
jgi:predicted nucleic-acid-binding protein